MLFGASDKDQQDGHEWTFVWQDPAWVFLPFATESGQGISVLVTAEEFFVLFLVCIIQQHQDTFCFMSTLLSDEDIQIQSQTSMA